MLRFCSLYSGSSGNSIYIGTQKTNLLIDAGVSGTRISCALQKIGVSPESIDALLITHEHSDHIYGAGILSRRFGVPIYATEKTWQAMLPEIGKLNAESIHIIDRKYFTLGDIDICAYPIPHDAADPTAYTFYTNNRKISVATDTGCVTEEMHENIIESDIALIESNHDEDMLINGRYPQYLKKRILSDKGHLSNLAASYFAAELALSGTKYIYLGHLSKENNYPELALSASENALLERGIRTGRDVRLNVAPRDTCSEVTEL